MRLVLVLFGVSALTGCAQYQWQKYGASQADFNKDVYECQMEAARTFPTQVVTQQVSSGYQAPSTTNCSGTSSAYGTGSSFGGVLHCSGQRAKQRELHDHARGAYRSHHLDLRREPVQPRPSITSLHVFARVAERAREVKHRLTRPSHSAAIPRRKTAAYLRPLTA